MTELMSVDGEVLGVLSQIKDDVKELLRAVREGGVGGGVCEAIQYLIADLMRALRGGLGGTQ